MKKIHSFLLVLLLAVQPFLGAGCLSAGRNAGYGNTIAYALPVSASFPAQEGATVEVPELGFTGTSPCQIRIPRSEAYKHVTVIISKPGFETVKYEVDMKIDAVGVAGLAGDTLLLIIFPPIGAAALGADLGTGAYRGVKVNGGGSVKEIKYTLIPVAGPPAPPATVYREQPSPGEAEFRRRSGLPSKGGNSQSVPTNPPNRGFEDPGDQEGFMTFGAKPGDAPSK